MRARAIGVLAAVAAIAAGVLLATRSSNEAPGPLIVRVDTAHPGIVIPRSFLGLSVEYQSVPAYFGRAGHVNRAFARLVGALGAAQRAPVGLRIGGNSTDESWWNPRRRPRPPGVLYDLGPAWAHRLAAGQAALRAPLALGLNLARGDPANALALVHAVRRAGLVAPGLTALEVGNEPDLFPRARRFRVGRLVVHRPRQRLRYAPAEYVREAAAFVDALARRLRGDRPPVAVGGFATDAWVRAAIGPLLRAEGRRIGELTAHAYALRECNPATPAAELRARLLTDDASRGLRSALTAYRADPAARRLALRVSELNSAVCGGVAGVSDVFAAALWAPDALFALAAAGVAQVDVHTWAGSYYAPIAVSRAGAVTARPLYYGLLAFTRAAPAGSRLVPVELVEPGSVRAWATRDAAGRIRVLLVNRSAGTARVVRVDLGAGARRARLALLHAPGLDARAGAALSARGAVAVLRGQARLRLPAASAALLTAR